MTMHTKGPWWYGPDEYSFLSFGINSDNGAIAEVYKTRSAYGGRSFSPELLSECEANARLISAAPELLEALREFVDNACFSCSLKERCKKEDDVCLPVENGKSALAKATGVSK